MKTFFFFFFLNLFSVFWPIMTMAFKKALYFLYSQITSQSTTTLLHLLQKEIRIALRKKKKKGLKLNSNKRRDFKIQGMGRFEIWRAGR